MFHACCVPWFTCSTAAFLPFLKKKPLVAAPKKEEEEDPLALPLPPPPKYLTSSNKATAFVSKLNTGKAKPSSSKAAAGSKNGRPLPAAGNGRPLLAAKAAKTGPGQSPAAAKADAEARRLRQLERMVKLGSLATSDAPPELRQKVEEAKRKAEAIKKQKEEAAQRQAEAERRRQLREAQLQRLQLEKQKQQEAKQRALHGSNAAIPRPRSLAEAGGAQQQRGGPPGKATAGAAARQAAGAGPQQQHFQQQSRPQQPQSNRDPYAHLPPKVSVQVSSKAHDTPGLCCAGIACLCPQQRSIQSAASATALAQTTFSQEMIACMWLKDAQPSCHASCSFGMHEGMAFCRSGLLCM